MMQRDDWRGCYNEGWNGEIVSDAFAHPAKFSRGLIKRIYQHIIDEGWAQPGDTILDPFGGVALGGLDAMKHGLHFVGVELEPKFVELGQQNIALWNDLAKRATAWGLDGWGSAILLQGDSRELSRIIGGAAVACSSPPYISRNPEANSKGINLEKQYETYKASGGGMSFEGFKRIQEKHSQGYGSGSANLANLPEGSHALAISSPPYANGCRHTGGDDPHPEKMQGGKFQCPGLAGAISSPPYAASLASDDPDRRGGLYRDPKRRGDRTLTAEYGSTEGQLAAMSVSSPPFEKQLPSHDNFTPPHDTTRLLQVDYETAYGKSDGQLGVESGQDFWSAARQIVEQLALVLRPGAHAVWVLKAFIRNGEYVNFPEQWMHLCEACGFETLHWHRAWLIEERGAQYTLDGGVEEKRVERKSFFRRLAERNGSPRVDYEVVLCMVRR